MNAIIDIKTPADKSLEGFPVELAVGRSAFFLGDDNTVNLICDDKDIDLSLSVHKNDKITIEIL